MLYTAVHFPGLLTDFKLCFSTLKPFNMSCITVLETKQPETSQTIRREHFPPKLDESFISRYPKLDLPQAGHLRHFHNLATLPDGEWTHIGAQDPGQE